MTPIKKHARRSALLCSSWRCDRHPLPWLKAFWSEWFALNRLAVAAALFGACAGLAAAAQAEETTLSRRQTPYTLVKENVVEVRFGDLTAHLANNEAVGPDHRAGYNGLIDLRYAGGPSPFVPFFAGLNLEHVNNGKSYADRDLQFEPRRHPMEIRKIDETTYELCQSALPNTGLESCTRFSFREPHFIDVTFECIPRLKKFPFGYLNVFWASYILQPEDMSIYFLGRNKGETGEGWVQGVTPKHGELSTHRSSKDEREFQREESFPLSLVFSESRLEYTQPFYYARFKDFVWIVLFRENDLVRFTQSPSGGGQGNPAWDFQWFIDAPKQYRLYRLSFRAIYKPWKDRDDVVMEYERFRAKFE
ncbi:MAG: hypothetical protein AB1898_18515 [Acidobacteriota bacterium]